MNTIAARTRQRAAMRDTIYTPNAGHCGVWLSLPSINR